MAVAEQRERLDNRLIASLSGSDQALLASRCKTVTLKLRQRLETPNRRIKAIYFPEHGLASIVGIGAGDRRQAEVAIVGREGMTGSSWVLGVDRSPHDTFMHLEGSGQCITLADLRTLMAESTSLRSALLRFVYVLGVQVAHNVVANAKGTLEERVARWLLMTHDRVDDDCVNLTHDFIALMLGTRRAGVTIALQKLQAERAVTHSRGCITILDRERLHQVAGGLYGVPEEEYERLFPPR